MTGTSRVRTATGTFTWAAVILLIASWFFFMAASVETPWIDNMTADGTGPLVVTIAMTVPFLLVLLGVRLFLYRTARTAVLLGWAASIPLFAALTVVAHDMVS
ncbi:hypothetical protein [Actinoplanes missouriensis]|nr:hypothetical protein [Actinoplanes missouriensis]